LYLYTFSEKFIIPVGLKRKNTLRDHTAGIFYFLLPTKLSFCARCVHTCCACWWQNEEKTTDEKVENKMQPDLKKQNRTIKVRHIVLRPCYCKATPNGLQRIAKLNSQLKRNGGRAYGRHLFYNHRYKVSLRQ
jgi:hypothetical protein